MRSFAARDFTLGRLLLAIRKEKKKGRSSGVGASHREVSSVFKDEVVMFPLILKNIFSGFRLFDDSPYLVNMTTINCGNRQKIQGMGYHLFVIPVLKILHAA